MGAMRSRPLGRSTLALAAALAGCAPDEPATALTGLSAATQPSDPTNAGTTGTPDPEPSTSTTSGGDPSSDSSAPTTTADTTADPATCVEADCPMGQFCDPDSGACEPGCSDDTDCMKPLVCDVGAHACAGCVDSSHCALGTVCTDGACAPGCAVQQPCNDGLACCAGACLDLLDDPLHCGACDIACPVPANAAAICTMSNCGLGACADGFANCDGDAANGCEVDLLADTAHCGGCATACPSVANGSSACVGASCRSVCAAGFADCDGVAANGCEVDTRSDGAHCGACSTSCTAGRTCQAGACTAATCAAGRANCDGLESTGCEVTPASNTAHCGACGHSCSFIHTTAECAAGVCGWSVCDVGFADVDGLVADGCEVNLRTDPNHCGAVGRVCPGACAAGECEVRPSMAAGVAHTCALLRDGTVKCWGENTSGQLGDGTRTSRPTPAPVVGLGGRAIAIAAGARHTCALSIDGGVRCWGANFVGQLGDGSFVDRTAPTPVVNLGGTGVAIIAGGSNTCALLSSGVVRCWGHNSVGALGDGTLTSREAPVSVVDLGGAAVSLSTSGYHTCAVLSGGAVRCWGSNQFGELGAGSPATTEPTTRPVSVVDLGGAAVSVAAAFTHTCALLSGGGVRCWGYRREGELGDGSPFGSAPQLTPVSVVGLGAVATSIVAGLDHTCAVLVGGAVRCWGHNDLGELGYGGTLNQNAPASVLNLGGVAGSLTAGLSHTCATLVDGTARCWGSNAFGQLGDGTQVTRLSAVPVLGLP